LNGFQKAEEEKNGFLRTKFNNPFSTDNAMNRCNTYQPTSFMNNVNPTSFMNNMNNLYPDVNDMQRRKF